MADFSKNRFRFARKEHACHWCDRAIHEDAEYIYCVGVVDHQFRIAKYHIDCMRAFAPHQLERMYEMSYAPLKKAGEEARLRLAERGITL